MSSNPSNYQYLPGSTEQKEPSRREVVVSLLLPTDACPTKYTEAAITEMNASLSGTQRYTFLDEARPSSAPPGMTFPAETVDVPYDRVFVNTIHKVGPRDLSEYLNDYQKETIRDLYSRVRTKYLDNRPTVNIPFDSTDWDLQHGTAYSKAFVDTVGIFRAHLPGIALQCRMVSAPELLTSWNSPPSLRTPGYRLHEILPVVLVENTTVFEGQTAAPTESREVRAGETEPELNFDEFLVPDLEYGRIQWDDGTTV